MFVCMKFKQTNNPNKTIKTKQSKQTSKTKQSKQTIIQTKQF